MAAPKTYALSTMWTVKRFSELSPFFKGGEEAGFAAFELNHGVDSSMLKGLEGKNIQSVHEPCPADISTSVLKENDWLISALDEENRRQGVLAIQRSIEFAFSLGVKRVVVHPGRVDSDYDTEGRMRELYSQGRRKEAEYEALLRLNSESRARSAEANLRQVEKSLDELGSFAAERDILLGLENRYHFHEIPSPQELGRLLERDSTGALGFWYDCGHAEVMDRLGFFAHEEWLVLNSRRIIGTHFHDLRGVEDHQAAGSGDFDWSKIAGRIPEGALRTCEFQ
ncbi:MAG: xylose isomerase, partial [Spirochaetes bacterium]